MKADRSNDFKLNQENQTILQIFSHSLIPTIENKPNISQQDFDKIIKYLSFLPIDHTDNLGRTALHYAAKNGFRLLIEYLIKNNA